MSWSETKKLLDILIEFPSFDMTQIDAGSYGTIIEGKGICICVCYGSNIVAKVDDRTIWTDYTVSGNNINSGAIRTGIIPFTKNIQLSSSVYQYGVKVLVVTSKLKSLSVGGGA
jgi:hypothetical protein